MSKKRGGDYTNLVVCRIVKCQHLVLATGAAINLKMLAFCFTVEVTIWNPLCNHQFVRTAQLRSSASLYHNDLAILK